MLAEALEHLVRGIVDHPDDVEVRSREQRHGRLLEVRVHPDDLGKVIGRGGRTATAFRTVLGAVAGTGVRIDFVDVDERQLVLVTVGRIGRAHGIRGEVSVEVRTDSPDVRFVAGARLMTEPERAGPLTVRQTRWHSGRLLVSFAGVADRAGAEALRGVLLVTDVDADERPADPDEYFDHQLLGLHAVTADGGVVGEVTDVLHLPDQDLLVITRTDGTEVLVPFVATLVPEVDLAGRRVFIDPPRGLLDPTEADEATP